MRTRSEYRMSPIRVPRLPVALAARPPGEADRDALAAVMLDAYRGTVDDEGEDLVDARRAIDHYLATIRRAHSFVVVGDDDVIVAFSFVVFLEGLHDIDPVVVASAHKRRGLGSVTVGRCLRSLADAGIVEVGATITDGNVASERLFAQLGFSRRGTWT